MRLRPLLAGLGAAAALALAVTLTPTRWESLVRPAVPAFPPELVTGGFLFRAFLVVDALLLALAAAWPAGKALPRTSSELSDGMAGYGRILAAILLGALGLRLWHLQSGLWIDEIATLLDYVRPPLATVWTTYESANQHPLYSLLARSSIAVLGESAFALRLPAALLGVAGVWAFAQLAREMLGSRIALEAAAILAAAYPHVYFSQNARGYTGLLFLSTIGTLLFLRSVREPRAGRLVGYVLAMTLANWFHLSGVVVTAGHALALLGVVVLGASRASALRTVVGRLVLAWGAIAYLTVHFYAPVIPAVQAHFAMASREALGWELGWELLRVTLRDAGIPRGPAGVLLLVVGAAIAAAGVVAMLRKAPLATAALLLPHAVFFLVVATMQLGTYPRFYLLALPVALLAFVAGVEQLTSRRAAVAAILLATVAANLALLARYYRLPKQDFPGALAWIATHRAPGEEIVAVGLARTCLRYYDPAVRPVDTKEEIDSLRRSGRDLLVITTFEEDLYRRLPAVAATLERDFRVEAVFPGAVGDGAVVLRRPRR